VLHGDSAEQRVESRAKNNDLAGPSFHSSGHSIFRNPASRDSQQTSDAGQGVRVRKLQHVLFVFAQNFHGKCVIED